jgi:hypothetical protein
MKFAGKQDFKHAVVHLKVRLKFMSTDSKRLQIIAWSSTFLACLFLTGMYFVANSVIAIFGNMFSGMGVELPLLTRLAFIPYLLPTLFVGAGVFVLGKELFVRDKKRSLFISLYVALFVLFAFGCISLVLYLPLHQTK